MSFGTHSFSDLDFANDVDFLAELHELLVPALETTASEAAYLELEVNWQKTEVQPLCSREDEPTITVQGLEVAAVKEFVMVALYLLNNCCIILAFPFSRMVRVLSSYQERYIQD